MCVKKNQDILRLAIEMFQICFFYFDGAQVTTTLCLLYLFSLHGNRTKVETTANWWKNVTTKTIDDVQTIVILW